MLNKLLIATTLFNAAFAGKCFSGEKSKELDKENVMCPQYNKDSCCEGSQAFVKGGITADDGCTKVSSYAARGNFMFGNSPLEGDDKGSPDVLRAAAGPGLSGNTCMDLYSLATCGFGCRPDFEKDFIKDGEVKICKDFYEKLETACADFTVCPEGENCHEDKDKCEIFFSEDNKGKKFDKDAFEAQITNGLKLKKVDGTDGCFNSAGRPGMFAATLAAAGGMIATGNAGAGAAMGLAALLGGAYAGECDFTVRDKAKANEGTTFCPQYADDACCEPMYVKVTGQTGDGCNGASALNCQDKMFMISCAQQCKPKFQEDYVSRDDSLVGTFTICEQFYEKLVGSCEEIRTCKPSGDGGDSGSGGDPPNNCVADDGDCVSAFPKGGEPGKDYDEDTLKLMIAQSAGATKLKVDKSNDPKKCFNAAPQAALTAAAVLAAAFVRL